MPQAKPIRYKAKIGVLEYMPGMHYLEVPAKIVKSLGGKIRGRFICRLSKAIEFPCGLMALGEGRGYIMLSKKRLKEIGAKLGDTIAIELRADTSRYGMEMCDELKEVLLQDPEGQKRFDLLTPGKQRMFIHYVGAVKNIDKRIERAIQYLENLKLLPVGKESVPKILGIKT
jgi:hypothetical protein